MTTFELIVTIFGAVGGAAIFGAFIYIGRKLQVLDDMQVTTIKIKKNVKVISDYLTSSTADFNHKEIQSYSPLKLTADGKKLIKQLGFDTVVKDNADDFCDYIDSQQPKLKYEVEAAAIQSISALYDMDYMKQLKVFLYNNPERNLKNIAPTLGIYVRDKYLAKHPEITE